MELFGAMLGAALVTAVWGPQTWKDWLGMAAIALVWHLIQSRRK